MTAPTSREELLAKAAQDFIDKVDRGEARSTRSYEAFKAALAVPAQRPAELTEDQIMSVLRTVTKGELFDMLTFKVWKDGIDIDRPTFAAERLAEMFRKASPIPSTMRGTP